MDAALLETGKKITGSGNQGEPVWETKDLQEVDYCLDKQYLLRAGATGAAVGKATPGRGEGRQELLSRRTELQGLFTPPLSMREEHRALPMEMNLGSGVRQSCESGGSTHSQFPCPNEPQNRSVFCHLSP